MSFFDDAKSYQKDVVWNAIVKNDYDYIAKTFTTPDQVLKLISPKFMEEVRKNPANNDADIRFIAATERMLRKFGHPAKWDEMALKDAGWIYKRHVYMKCHDDFDAMDHLPREIRNWLNNSPYQIDARDALHLYAIYLSFESSTDQEAVQKTLGRLEHWVTTLREANKEALDNRDSFREVDPMNTGGTLSEKFQKAKEMIYAA